MSPADWGADLMKLILAKWDKERPLSMNYCRYTSQGLDAFESWLTNRLQDIQVQRELLAKQVALEVEYDNREKNAPLNLKKWAE